MYYTFTAGIALVKHLRSFYIRIVMRTDARQLVELFHRFPLPVVNTPMGERDLVLNCSCINNYGLMIGSA